jgi:hypothetical protein
MITNGQSSIGTVASAIDGNHANSAIITIHNMDNTDTVYIGGTGVTTTNGLALQKEQTIQFELQPLEQLYAVSSKAGHSISWLRQAF